MNFTQKSRLRLHAKSLIGRWTPHITETDTSRTDGDVIDAGAGDDRVIASWGNDRIKGVERSITTNSIALRADSMPATCSKRLKNRAKTSLQRCAHRKYKPNQPVAGIEPAQSAIEFVVTRIESHQGAVHA